MNKIVLFYSDSCQPCGILRPIIERMTEEKNIYLEKVCVDNSAGAQHAEAHQVAGWPTAYAVKDDVIIGQLTGADPKANEKEHADRIEKLLFLAF